MRLSIFYNFSTQNQFNSFTTTRSYRQTRSSPSNFHTQTHCLSHNAPLALRFRRVLLYEIFSPVFFPQSFLFFVVDFRTNFCCFLFQKNVLPTRLILHWHAVKDTDTRPEDPNDFERTRNHDQITGTGGGFWILKGLGWNFWRVEERREFLEGLRMEFLRKG